MSKILLTLCLLPLIRAITNGSDPIVETNLGLVKGLEGLTSRTGRQYLAFRSIPYAEPPVGPLRFQPPKPLSPWEGVKDATQEVPVCLQQNTYQVDSNDTISGQEDCLYLSLYTHSVSGKRPVLVHFHGGGFKMGTANWYGPVFLMDEDVVIVNANYRLAILGFLCFENADMPGNQGLKDQLMVLNWVQQNIEYFGGDPESVTIIGESAGGASIYHHIISPRSNGLFHRAIAESGTSYAIWALTPPGFAKSISEELMTMLGCPIDSKEAIPCVMEKNGTEIVSKLANFVEFQIDPILTFAPCLEEESEDAFLVGPIAEWKHSPVPLLMGITSGDGFLRVLPYALLKTNFTELSEEFDTIGPMSLLFKYSSSEPNEVFKSVREYYLPNKEITLDNWVNLTAMYTDSWFTTSGMDGANKHSGEVFFYYFDYLSNATISYPPEVTKLIFASPHTIEAQYLWNLTWPFFPHFEHTEEDTRLSKSLVKLVADFAKYGTPAPEGSSLIWEKWTPDSNNFIHIDNNGFHPKTGLADEVYRFFNSIPYKDNYY